MNDTQRKLKHNIDCQELFINEPHLIPEYNKGTQATRKSWNYLKTKSPDEKRAFRLGYASRMNELAKQHGGDLLTILAYKTK